MKSEMSVFYLNLFVKIKLISFARLEQSYDNFDANDDLFK